MDTEIVFKRKNYQDMLKWKESSEGRRALMIKEEDF